MLHTNSRKLKSSLAWTTEKNRYCDNILSKPTRFRDSVSMIFRFTLLTFCTRPLLIATHTSHM